MIQRLLRRVRPGDDRGALLIIAIVIVTVVALVTGFVLTQGDGSLRATVALRDVARASYAADGAAQVAINDLRTGYNVGNGEPTPWYYTNEVGTGCFGYDGAGALTTPKNSLVLDNLIPKQGGRHAERDVGRRGVHTRGRHRRSGLRGADQQRQQAGQRHPHPGDLGSGGRIRVQDERLRRSVPGARRGLVQQQHLPRQQRHTSSPPRASARTPAAPRRRRWSPRSSTAARARHRTRTTRATSTSPAPGSPRCRPRRPAAPTTAR